MISFLPDMSGNACRGINPRDNPSIDNPSIDDLRPTDRQPSCFIVARDLAEVFVSQHLSTMFHAKQLYMCVILRFWLVFALDFT